MQSKKYEEHLKKLPPEELLKKVGYYDENFDISKEIGMVEDNRLPLGWKKRKEEFEKEQEEKEKLRIIEKKKSDKELRTWRRWEREKKKRHKEREKKIIKKSKNKSILVVRCPLCWKKGLTCVNCGFAIKLGAKLKCWHGKHICMDCNKRLGKGGNNES